MSIKFLMKKAGLSPATSAILAGGVGAGAGYLLDKYQESRGYRPANKWARPLAVGLLASSPFLAHGYVRGGLDKINGKHTTGVLNRWFTDDATYEKNPVVRYNLNMNAAESRRLRMDEKDENGTSKWRKKYSYANFGGPLNDMSQETIPVNAFNETMWLDASRGRTPTETAGLFSSTLNATSNRVGSGFVTPGQVMGTLVNAGIGYGTAWLTGKALGAMAGVSQESQNKLCEMGTWGGMLNGLQNKMTSNFNNPF